MDNMIVALPQRLEPPQVTEVLALAQAAADADQVYPFAEQVVLRLRHDGDAAAVHLLARDGDRLAGYAHVDPGGADADAADAAAVAELVVHPAHRRRGVGGRLAQAALTVARERHPAGRLRVWAHGDHPGAAALAQALGFARARVLHQLRRPLADPLPELALPPGVRLRTFRPGHDDQAWLRVNALAFADHPEQGRWSAQDLHLRQQEPWFDPDGFLLAVEDDQAATLLGFHWTKVHPGEAGQDPIGEVYVVGVDPSAHGRGLGKALTVAGLRYLRDRGLGHVMLYVDESNTAAMAMYEALGFRGWSVDVMYAYPGDG